MGRRRRPGSARLVPPVLTLALLCGARTVPAADAPWWLRQMALRESPAFGPTVPAIVLHDGLRVAVEEAGRRRVETRAYALRVLSNQGRQAAVARVVYERDSARVRELNAWIVGPAGRSRQLGKGEVVDVAIGGGDLHSEARARLLDASDQIAVGEVFGFESVVEREAEFNQVQWSFQSQLPALRSRYKVVLPEGWTAHGTLFNGPPLAPTVEGSTYVWELRDLPYLEPEPRWPGPAGLAPRLAVTLRPPAGTSDTPPSFDSWRDVGRWANALHDPRALPDAAVTAQASELARGLEGELDRIRAVARFVQRVPYISVQIGLGRFQPHPAAEVLAKAYGDCKDKATLLRSLLSVLGIASYPLLVSVDGRGYVRAEWPSPTQFNHVILAIRTDAAAGSPAAVDHPTLGRLLLFDPTDPDTVLGDLPRVEQGSSALLAAGAGSELLTVPTVPPSANHLRRETSARLGAEGQLSGRIVETSTGQAAAEERRIWRGHSRPDYQAILESWLARGMPAVRATAAEAADDPQGPFRLQVDFATDRYGQVMQGRLMIFKPALVARRESPFLTDPERRWPIVLEAESYDETAQIELPPGFRVDELPEPVMLTTPFGGYAFKVEAQDGRVVLQRHLTTQAVTLPVGEYPNVRRFYQAMTAAERAPVVLVKE